MKYIFLASFIAMLLLSAVAWLWQPRPVDNRVVWLDFFLTEADADHNGKVTRGEVQALFNQVDSDHDGILNQAEQAAEASSAHPDRRFAFLFDVGDQNDDERAGIDELLALFGYLDRNRDGVLTHDDTPQTPPVELVWCSDDNPVRRGQIRLFNRYHPDFHLRLDPQNSTMEKVIVQSLAGVGPDLFDCYNGYQLSAYVRSGIAMDITDVMPRYGISANDLWPSLRPLILHENRYYGSVNNAGAQAFWFNKRVFDEAGIPYPTSNWTWDDCISICRSLTRRNERGQITRYGIIGYWDWKLALFQHGVRFFSPEGTRSLLDSPEAAAGMQFMQDLVYKYEVMPTPQAETAMASAGGWGTGVIALFGAERAAMAIGGRWWLCILRNKDYAALDLGAVENPALRLPDGALSRRLYGYGRSTQVNATGENAEAAMQFIQFLHSREWSDLINRQADAMGPVAEYNYTQEFLHNPDFPKEDFHAVWRTAMENAEPEEVSPYVNGQTVDRILFVQTDLVRANLKSGGEAMRDAATKINEAIVETLQRDPELRRKYFEALEQGAQPAWDRQEDAP